MQYFMVCMYFLYRSPSSPYCGPSAAVVRSRWRAVSSRNRHRAGPLGAGARGRHRFVRSSSDTEPGRERRAAEPAGRLPPGPELPPWIERRDKGGSNMEGFFCCTHLSMTCFCQNCFVSCSFFLWFDLLRQEGLDQPNVWCQTSHLQLNVMVKNHFKSYKVLFS